MKRRRLWALAVGIAVVAGYLCLAFLLSALPQNIYYQLTECPIPGHGQKVLVFTPHPDDESLAVGGYLFSSRRAGADVRVVLATDGNRHGLRDKRYQEFREATAQLLVDPDELHFWGYPDGKLSAYFDQLEPEIENEMILFQPEYVIYPDPEDQHPDHSALGRAVETALAKRTADGECIEAYAYLIHYKYFPEPKVMNFLPHLLPPSTVYQHNEIWNKVTLTDDAKEAKYNALHQYHTQQRNPFLKPIFTGLMRSNELLVGRNIEPVQQL